MYLGLEVLAVETTIKKSSSESSPLGTLLVEGGDKTRLVPLPFKKKTVYTIILVQESFLT